MIPLATLESNVSALRVIPLANDRLQARDGRDGKLLWDTRVPLTTQAILTSDPATNEIYISATSSPMLTTVSADDGHILWQFSICTGQDDHIPLGARSVYIICGQPAAAGLDDPNRTTLYALDARTGAVRWQAAERHARTLVDAKIVAQTPEGLAALDGATGAMLWQHAVDIAAETASAVAPLDTFAFVVRAGPTSTLYYSPDGLHVEALRSSEGTLLWRSRPVQDTASPPNGTFTQHAPIALATANEVVTQGIYGVTVLRASDGTLLRDHPSGARRPLPKGRG
jgi:outer membrane protein assembly factor BamB